jgi:hypothetical protein
MKRRGPFFQGVEAAVGWSDYTVLKNGDVVPQDAEGNLTVDEDGDIIILDEAGDRVERGGSDG